MAAIQHEGARKLLRLISSPSTNKTPLTYKQAAKLLGRIPPGRHSRAVAQMCDLLDAAAALAGVPLLALVRVLANNLKINPRAWKEIAGIRRTKADDELHGLRPFHMERLQRVQ